MLWPPKWGLGYTTIRLPALPSAARCTGFLLTVHLLIPAGLGLHKACWQAALLPSASWCTQALQQGPCWHIPGQVPLGWATLPRDEVELNISMRARSSACCPLPGLAQPCLSLPEPAVHSSTAAEIVAAACWVL